ncbi:prolyl hydroxylase family protein [Sphingomonas sp. M1-B02]|uniref:prolyl hydroxylase family protein n=1 Tax=Sphingomonas sp. M1-B02 TaxID=3114300 RepID=UPI0022403356|nr:2OG-Fe(II) oxygenase [Sphingomonas sp. S6-11]UZK67040.1 2OG-Fe(II) oxygenase [Sphingomonas sp. S6-11]
MSKNIGTISGGPSPLRARIGREVSARLEANPAVKRARTEAAQMYSVDAFISDAECDTLIGLIDAAARPSTLLAMSDDPDYRTSHSSDLHRWSDEVRTIDLRIANLLGIAEENAETLQGQRYAVDQQFRAHCDYFHEQSEYWAKMKETGGQRTWTAMAYLNQVEEGGATWFPRAGMRFKPKRGMLVVWNNMLPDGTPNYDTLHEGMRVIEGMKYIVTKWFREGAWIKDHITTYIAGGTEKATSE